MNMSIRWRIQNITAMLGLALLKASGAYDGYWKPWRGRLFDIAERKGLHVLPVHYYSPIPNVGGIDSQIWETRDHLFGIDMRLDDSIEQLFELEEKFSSEYNKFNDSPGSGPHSFGLNNPAFGPGDAEAYYSLLRHLKPRKVVEIGCGFSTLVASMAIQKNGEEDPRFSCDYLCIEPYLPDYLDPLPLGISRVLRKGVQSVPLSVFEDLEAGDVLFIDSTHVVAIGSDVVYEYLEILPRLKPGVFVHIHDIFLPLDYPCEWMTSARFFWNEQYLLQAYLLGNASCEIVLPMHALYTTRRDFLTRAIPSVRFSRLGPSSFWLRII